MATHGAVHRTAPIAIAPKPPRQPPSRQSSIYTDTYLSGMSGYNSAESGSPINGNSPGPCASCLRRRIKCVMSEDDESCVSCQANGTECQVESPQPRKRKLNGHGEQADGKRGSPRSDNRRRRQHQPSLSSTAGSSSLIEEMANFGGPTLLKRTLGLQEDRFSQYIGPTTDFEPSLINLSPFDPHDESLLARGTLRKVSENDTFLLLPDSNTLGYEHVRDDIEEIEAVVAPHGRKLVDLYFRVVHPGFPIIQKTVFYEKYERSYKDLSPPLLAAIYLLAVNWWDQDDELAHLPRPNIPVLEKLMRTTLADSMWRPKLSTVQAGLLLSQRPEGDQWAPTAQLVAIAQELGLHLDCTPWKIPPWEKGLRKRLAWALYMQDKWGALVHGRPSHIFASNWAVQAITQNDFPDVEWDESDAEEKLDVERGRTLFVQMVQLSQILAEILETFFTIQAMQTVANAGPQGTHLVLSLAKPIQIKLKTWYSELPAAIRMDSTYQSLSAASSRDSGRLSSIGYVHLAYFAAEITLHRRIIRSLDTSDSAASSSSASSTAAPGVSAAGGPAFTAVNNSNSHSAVGSPSAVDAQLLDICRSAARARLVSAMDFVNRLTPSHLRAFWYFASKTNFALIGTFGSLLWATARNREEAEWFRRRLAEYRWTLSVSSKPGDGAGGGGGGGSGKGGLTEFAMGMLDISTGLLKKLPEKPSMSRSASTADLEQMEAARRGSLLALGSVSSVPGGMGMLGGGGGFSSFGGGSVGSGLSGLGGYGHSFSGLGMGSPLSEDGEGELEGEEGMEGEDGSESSEEAVYGNFGTSTRMTH